MSDPADTLLAAEVARLTALLERVTVLERALGQFADPLGWPPSLREKPYIVAMRRAAQRALDG